MRIITGSHITGMSMFSYFCTGIIDNNFGGFKCFSCFCEFFCPDSFYKYQGSRYEFIKLSKMHRSRIFLSFLRNNSTFFTPTQESFRNPFYKSFYLLGNMRMKFFDVISKRVRCSKRMIRSRKSVQEKKIND